MDLDNKTYLLVSCWKSTQYIDKILFLKFPITPHNTGQKTYFKILMTNITQVQEQSCSRNCSLGPFDWYTTHTIKWECAVLIGLQSISTLRSSFSTILFSFPIFLNINSKLVHGTTVFSSNIWEVKNHLTASIVGKQLC